MEFFLFLLVLFAIIFPLFRERKVKRLIKKLQSHIQDLELKIQNIKSMHGIDSSHVGDHSDSVQVEEKVGVSIVAKPASSIPVVKPILKKKEPSGFAKKISSLEKIFVENWTGILGSIILVIGIAFFGITAGLILSPFARFLLINIFTGLLYGLYLFLRKKVNMELLSLWIRSTAGALFLFTCLGSGGIPGLKWIENPMLALALLLFGVIVNLLLGFISKKQMLATFHVALSLIALAIAPQNYVTILLVGGIVFFGIILSYREKWDFHLLLTILSFFSYHLFWNNAVGNPKFGESPVNFISGIGINTLVGVAAIFIHYRAIYARSGFKVLPFLTHLLNWLTMGIGYILYSSGSKWNPFVLIAASICVFILSRKARKLEMRWLFRTDILVAESLILLGIVFLHRWELSSVSIAFLVLLEILMFTAIMLYEKDDILTRIGFGLTYLSNINIMLAYLLNSGEGNKTSSAILILAAVLLNTIFPILMRNKNPLDFDSEKLLGMKKLSINITGTGIFASILSIILFVNFAESIWAPGAVSILYLIVLVSRRRFFSQGSGLEFLFMAGGIHLVSWIFMSMPANIDTLTLDRPLFDRPSTILFWLMYGVPLFLISATSLTIGLKKENGTSRKLLGPGIYLFTLHMIVLSYFAFNDVSPFIPGILYLLYSILFLELARIVVVKWKDRLCENGNADTHLYMSGIIMLIAFIFRHVLVHLQSEYYFGYMKLRLLIELFAIMVLLYRAVFNLYVKSRETFITKNVSSYNWEVLLIFVSFTIALELPGEYLAAGWITLALLLYVISKKDSNNFSRFRLYSVVFQIVSAFHIAFVSGSHVTPSNYFMDQAWTGGFLALGMQFIYVFFYLRDKSIPSEFSFPKGLGFLTKLSGLVERKKNLFINYPLFIAIALFLYWSFDSAILTLLWTVEIFSIFVLSIALREKHFRHISMGLLLIIVGRLIFYDMEQTEAIYKIFAFMGVGILLIFMNYLYNKYKDRF